MQNNEIIDLSPGKNQIRLQFGWSIIATPKGCRGELVQLLATWSGIYPTYKLINKAATASWMLLKDTRLPRLYYLQSKQHTTNMFASFPPGPPRPTVVKQTAQIDATPIMALPYSQGALRLGTYCFTANNKQAYSLSQQGTLSHPSRWLTINITLKNGPVE